MGKVKESGMSRTQSALQFISAQERDVWVSMAMAVKSDMGDAGFDIWDDWSQSATNYNASAARSVWRSCRGSGITIASLYHEAKQNGWRDVGFQKPTPVQIQARHDAAAERASQEGLERTRRAREAAKKAEWILSQCKFEKHAYLHSKGFTEHAGLVWWPDDKTNLLCIPMYVNGCVAGLQMIDREGGKKYLSDQVTSSAEFCIHSGGLQTFDYWVEGYASGLSLQACLHALKLPHRIHITFSAQNLKRMAHSGFVIADNDTSLTGQNAAKATGLPFWMPTIEGEDINDVHKQQGTFRTSQLLRKWLQSVREEVAVT